MADEKSSRQIHRIGQKSHRSTRQFAHPALDEPIVIRSLTQKERILVGEKARQAQVTKDRVDLQKMDAANFQIAQLACMEADGKTPLFTASDREIWDELDGAFVADLLAAIMEHTGLASKAESDEAKN